MHNNVIRTGKSGASLKLHGAVYKGRELMPRLSWGCHTVCSRLIVELNADVMSSK